MEIENPLLIPNLVWKIALGVTVLLIVIRAAVYFIGRNRRQLKVDNQAERVGNLIGDGEEQGRNKTHD